jgi:hypothetical protein
MRTLDRLGRAVAGVLVLTLAANGRGLFVLRALLRSPHD